MHTHLGIQLCHPSSLSSPPSASPAANAETGAQVGFSAAHARRACLATNLAGVPQAIEWALAHLDEETDAQKAPAQDASSGVPGSPGDSGLVVELPDGKLFKLSNPNGRVVEMPNGSVVEMIDGQVVEMSNGQQLEMVDGSLIEIRPAAVQLDDGEIVGHNILNIETSRRVAAGDHRAPHAAHDGADGAPPSRAPPVPAPLAPRDAGNNNNAQEERLRRHHMQVSSREEQLNAQAKQLSERDRAMSGKQQQLQAHQSSLQQQEEALNRQRAALQAEQDSLSKQAAALKAREAEVAQREAKLQRVHEEMTRRREQLRAQDRDIKTREEALLQRSANGASAASAGSTQAPGAGDDGAADGRDEQSAMDNIEAGRIRFAELTLGSLLGSGSFADVYRAEWRMPCAVKKMKGRISKEQMTEFVREGEMMRSLKHPGIVKLLGVCVENGSFYLVQEIVNGFGNLFDYLHKRKARLTYWQCVQIAVGIADAMAYLHDRHIVHRDLKPQNCLLVNEKGEVKLCDFGLARLKNAHFVETVSNTAGTPAYQAPEMLRDEPISEKVDLYGFGIMLWEMYTGKLPWSDKNYHQMIHTVAVRNERPPVTQDIPRELVQIIEECWHPLPQKRPRFQDLKSTFKELARTVPQQLPSSQPAPAAAHPYPVAQQQQQQQQQQRVPKQQAAAMGYGYAPGAVAAQRPAHAAYPAAAPMVYGGFPQQTW